LKKTIAKHSLAQSYKHSDNDDAIYHAAAARYLGMSSPEAEELDDPYLKNNDDYEATEEDITPVVAKPNNSSERVLKGLMKKADQPRADQPKSIHLQIKAD
jgi:hypothetical protein